MSGLVCVCMILYYRKCKDSLNNVQNMKEEEFVFFGRCKYFTFYRCFHTDVTGFNLI